MSTTKKQAPVAKKAAKKKTYNIECKQVVHYQRQVELTEEEFKLLDAASDTVGIHNAAAYNVITSWLSPHDIYDSDNEFTDFEITKVK